MLFTTETISNEEIKSINNFFNEYEAVETVAPEKRKKKQQLLNIFILLLHLATQNQLKILPIQKSAIKS